MLEKFGVNVLNHKPKVTRFNTWDKQINNKERIIRELFNPFELIQNRVLKIPAEFLIISFSQSFMISCTDFCYCFHFFLL